jgi:hypothetical protein
MRKIPSYTYSRELTRSIPHHVHLHCPCCRRSCWNRRCPRWSDFIQARWDHLQWLVAIQWQQSNLDRAPIQLIRPHHVCHRQRMSSYGPYSNHEIILTQHLQTISCNNNGGAGPSQQTATVAAGSEVIAYWSQWTHAQGPVMVYMASCGGSCSSVNSASLNWFKISERGLISGTQMAGSWGTGEVMKSCVPKG